MKKYTLHIICIGLFIFMSLTFIDLYAKENAINEEIIALKSIDNNEMDNTISNLVKENKVLEESIELLTMKLDASISSQEKLEGTVILLSDEVKRIPIDPLLPIRQDVQKWIDLFRDSLPNEVDMDEVVKIMPVSSNFYYEWYPKFNTKENMALIHHMMEVVFQPGEGMFVSPGFTLNRQYFVEDTDGNRIEIYYENGGIYSQFTYASLLEQRFSDFVEVLKLKDEYKLLEWQGYGDGPIDIDEEASRVFDEYIEPFMQMNIEEVTYRFDGVDLRGLRYIVYDQLGHELTYHIYHGDGFTVIRPISVEW